MLGTPEKLLKSDVILKRIYLPFKTGSRVPCTGGVPSVQLFLRDRLSLRVDLYEAVAAVWLVVDDLVGGKVLVAFGAAEAERVAYIISTNAVGCERG